MGLPIATDDIRVIDTGDVRTRETSVPKYQTERDEAVAGGPGTVVWLDGGDGRPVGVADAEFAASLLSDDIRNRYSPHQIHELVTFGTVKMTGLSELAKALEGRKTPESVRLVVSGGRKGQLKGVLDKDKINAWTVQVARTVDDDTAVLGIRYDGPKPKESDTPTVQAVA